MIRTVHRNAAFLALLLSTACGGSRSATVETAPAPGTAAAAADAEAETIPLYEDLGPYSRPIVTSSDEAQAYFDQGLLLMYAYGTNHAERSFKAAQAADPNCAACYWGEAWALSPYLNGGMSPGAERRAHAAIEKAKEHLDGATGVERALIDAFEYRFDLEPTTTKRKRLDTLYARKMGEVAERFPNDLDVQTLYAEALMLLRPRRGSVDLEAEDVKAILPVLEGVLAKDIRHPGSCHLYIHLVEASQNPRLAENCADYLGDQIAISHIRHMPSHIYMNIGRYSDAVRSNQRAWHADQMAEQGGPPGVYPSHNLHMLLFAAVLDGQSAVAIQAAKDLAKLQSNWSWYHPVTLAFFGRWEEVLAFAEAPEDPFLEAMWRYARGMAHLRTGNEEAATGDLSRIDAIIPTVEGARFRFHDQSVLLQIPRGLLSAEIAYAAGRPEEAIATLEATVDVEDGLTYDEPEPWHFPVRHTLGAMLLDLDRPAEAQAVYEAALDDHENSGWSLWGLQKALAAQGKNEAAAGAKAAFERHWARADIWLASTRY